MRRFLFATMALLGAYAGRAEDGYLESDGTQALNLGYIATPATRIEYDFQLLSAAGNGSFVCGVYKGDVAYGIWKNGSGNFEFRFNQNWSGSKDRADQARHVCTIDMATGLCRLLTDGEESFSHAFASLPAKNASFPLAAFAGGFNGSGTSFTSKCATRLYWIKVYEDDALVRSYVPCLKGGKAGFLEERSGQFLAPDVAVAACGAVKMIDDDPYVSTPDGEVIVNTGYCCGEKTRLECDYEILDDSSSDKFLFSGGFDDQFEVRAYVGTTSSGTKVINYGFCTNGSYASTQVAVGKGIRRTLTLDGAAGTCSLVSGVTTNFFAVMPQPYGGKSADTLRLFCLSREKSTWCIQMKLYGFRIYEDGVLVRDYRPTLVDGGAVLREAVYGSWIKSKTATELSSGGGVVENGDAYLESTGIQGVNLGYKVKTTSRVEVDFRFTAVGAGGCVLGGGISAGANKLRFGFVRNASSNFELCMPWNEKSVWSGGLFSADVKRHVGVLDVPRKKGTITRFGAAEASKTSTTNFAYDSTYPLGLFSTTTSTDGNSFSSSYLTSVRVYDIKIFESDVLVKHWIPYVHNGELVLKETMGGTFLGCGDNGLRTLPTAGGDIDYDSCPPYVESDGTQGVCLGVKPKMNARIEAEFAIVQTNNFSKGLVGACSGSDVDKTFFWFNGGGGFEPCIGGKYFGSWSGSGYGFSKRICVLDYSTKTAYLNGDAKQNAAGSITADATIPIGVFGHPNNAAGTTFSNLGLKARVYSVKVYESETLANEFVPWVKDGVIGFRDTVTGAFVTKHKTTVADLKIGGIGTSCDVATPSAPVPVDGEVTLYAGASGAVSYKWHRNGEEIAGETGATLSVSWRRKSTPDVISVRPVYQLYGRAILGDAVNTQVDYAPLGLAVIIR